VVSFLQVPFSTKSCMNLSSSTFVPRAPLIPFFPICSPELYLARSTLYQADHWFLFNNQPDALIIQILFCHKILHVSAIFSAHHQEFPSWLCLEAVIRNLHETYQCQMYSTKLLMMGREMPETCRVLWQNKIGIISASGWLLKRNLLRCTVTGI
jgi:hypothetical protein